MQEWYKWAGQIEQGLDVDVIQLQSCGCMREGSGGWRVIGNIPTSAHISGTAMSHANIHTCMT